MRTIQVLNKIIDSLLQTGGQYRVELVREENKLIVHKYDNYHHLYFNFCHIKVRKIPPLALGIPTDVFKVTIENLIGIAIEQFYLKDRNGNLEFVINSKDF